MPTPLRLQTETKDAYAQGSEVVSGSCLSVACRVVKTVPPVFAVNRYPGPRRAVARHDHVWILHRPKTLGDNQKSAALPVMEFDSQGKLVRAWGGPGAGYEWPTQEHGLFIDYKDNVWISGVAGNDANASTKSSFGSPLLVPKQPLPDLRTPGVRVNRFGHPGKLVAKGMWCQALVGGGRTPAMRRFREKRVAICRSFSPSRRFIETSGSYSIIGLL